MENPLKVLPMTTKKSTAKSGAKKKSRRYSAEFKLQAIRLHLEEGYTIKMVADEFGLGHSTMSSWLKRYRNEGEAGLVDRQPVHRGHKQISSSVKQRAVDLKKQDPSRGSRRISHLLKRFHLMKASPETVRRTLKEEGLVEPPKKKPQRNPQKPRFFERSTPNQLWQTDSSPRQ